MIERIRELCKKKNITIATLEKNLNYGNGTIRKWDKNSPTIEKVKQVAKELNVSIEWLITGKEAPDLSPEEQRLVEHYRSMNETGKRILMNDAAGIANSNPAGVSASKIG